MKGAREEGRANEGKRTPFGKGEGSKVYKEGSMRAQHGMTFYEEGGLLVGRGHKEFEST